jgi:hypothetical protein
MSSLHRRLLSPDMGLRVDSAKAPADHLGAEAEFDHPRHDSTALTTTVRCTTPKPHQNTPGAFVSWPPAWSAETLPDRRSAC